MPQKKKRYDEELAALDEEIRKLQTKKKDLQRVKAADLKKEQKKLNDKATSLFSLIINKIVPNGWWGIDYSKLPEWLLSIPTADNGDDFDLEAELKALSNQFIRPIGRKRKPKDTSGEMFEGLQDIPEVTEDSVAKD